MVIYGKIILMLNNVIPAKAGTSIVETTGVSTYKTSFVDAFHETPLQKENKCVTYS